MTVDQIDYQLIIALQKNPRQQTKELAKKLNLPETNIKRRINHMLDSGLIRLTAIPNPLALGYRIMAFISLQVEISRIEVVVERIMLHREVHYMALCTGNADLFIRAHFASRNHLAEYISNEIGAIPGVISLDVLTELKQIKFTYGRLCFNGPTRPWTSSQKGASEIMAFDKTDRKIIIELQKNSRQSNRQLAIRLKMDESTVRRRIKNLVHTERVELTAIPDPHKLGYLLHCFVGVQTDLGKNEEVANEIAGYPEVHYVGICSGRYPLAIWILVESNEKFSQLLKEKFSKIPGITRTESTIHLEYLKRTYGWLQLEP